MKYFVRNIKGKDGLDYVSIYGRVRHYTDDKKIAIGFKVFPTEWANYISGKFNRTDWMESLSISYAQFDSILAEIKTVLDSSFNPDTAGEDIMKVRDKNIFSPKAVQVVTCKDRYFSTFLLEYIDELKTGTRLKHGKSVPVSQDYIDDLKCFYNKFTSYEAENGRVTLDGIDMRFHDNYMAWCKSQNYTANTIASYFGNIARVLKIAFINKHTKNDIYLNPNFVPKRLVTDAVYLTTEQIDEMIALDFESDEVRKSLITIYTKLNQGVGILPKHIPVVLRSMERTRDTFIAGCLTGQRESDYFRYNKDMICLLNGMKFLNVKQVKTKKTVMIPLDKRVEHIINKYGGKMPKLCKATLNLYLPVICEILGWTWIPTLNNPSSFGKSSSRFCDLVRSHTARRSFATNAYKAGIPISSIIAITGHAREEGLRRYLKIQAEEKAILAEQNMQGFIL